MATDHAADSSGELTWQVEHLLGQELDGRYRIESLLGKGGMGAVLRAQHLFMEQPVAIKVLRPSLARDPSAARRFLREARGTLKVESDHAVKVLDFAITDDGMLYLVLELLDGRTVGAELADGGPLPLRRALRIARQICAALAAAHKVGLVHRDLKPDNVMLIRRGGDPDHVKVLDFGLAKVMEHAGQRALSLAALTQGDLVFGTPDYMAPEQAMGQPLDGRADLYAVGATLFEMLTGRPPFVGATMAVLADHVRTPPPTLAAAAGQPFPAEVEALVARCLAKDPAHRPASAEALAAELAALEERLGLVSRRGAQVATIDLDPGAVVAAVAATGPVGPAGAARPAPDPLAATPAAPAPGGWPITEAVEPAARRGLTRSPLLIALALSLAAATTIVLLAVTRERGPRGEPASGPGAGSAGRASMTASGSASASAAPGDPGVGAAGSAWGAGGGAEPSPPPALDAGVPAEVDGGPRVTGPAPGRGERAARLADHLAAADGARRRGNRLKQIAHADQALELDPRNHRARYLLGDALVSTDRVNGCKYLRSASRVAAARARADAAGCAP
ncbi:MAG: serine/threonine protein kinase [Kofleriaceae bacterium]|nr:serine/threonine protein kinase [Kofleriaceae bacterium]MCL4224039.1 serine/threonine protein kinase [Myxococcales bacterium]